MSEVHIYAEYTLPASEEEQATCANCGSTRVTSSSVDDGEWTGVQHCDDCGASIRFKPLEGPEGQPFAYLWETEIVWLEDIERLDYVRVGYWGGWAERAHAPDYSGAGRLVGYALLADRTPCPLPKGRRIFWLKDYDRDSAPDGVYAACAPMEAIDPRTVRPGFVGLRTRRVDAGTGCDVEAPSAPAQD
jgi:hypothetical protein